MLCTILGGMMIGAGIGIVIRAGASTGGMDIPPLILKKLFHLPVSATLYVFDFSILILQMFFSDIEESLYGILLVMIYTFVLDKVLVIGTHQARADIVSSHYEEIRRQFLPVLGPRLHPFKCDDRLSADRSARPDDRRFPPRNGFPESDCHGNRSPCLFDHQ